MKVKKHKKKLTNMVEFKEFLKNPSPKVKVPLYTEIEVNQNPNDFGDQPVKTSRLDRIEESIAKLADRMDANFEKVNARLDGIDTRLDYIVKVNNLKDSK